MSAVCRMSILFFSLPASFCQFYCRDSFCIMRRIKRNETSSFSRSSSLLVQRDDGEVLAGYFWAFPASACLCLLRGRPRVYSTRHQHQRFHTLALLALWMSVTVLIIVVVVGASPRLFPSFPRPPPLSLLISYTC